MRTDSVRTVIGSAVWTPGFIRRASNRSWRLTADKHHVLGPKVEGHRTGSPFSSRTFGGLPAAFTQSAARDSPFMLRTQPSTEGRSEPGSDQEALLYHLDPTQSTFGSPAARSCTPVVGETTVDRIPPHAPGEGSPPIRCPVLGSALTVSDFKLEHVIEPNFRAESRQCA